MDKLLAETNQDWEDLAKWDALWAILSSPEKKYGKWIIEEFFLIGEQEVEDIFSYLSSKGINQFFSNVLDFGCGVGRLANRFSKHCGSYYGVDVSATMLQYAKKFNQNNSKCIFLSNTNENLNIFEDNYFEFIYSNIVLQHIHPDMIKKFIKEFIRILKPDGYLYFQLPSYIPIRHRFQPRRHFYRIFKSLGFPSKFLWEIMKLSPIRMSYLPIKTVLELIKQNANVQILEIKNPNTYATKYLIQKLQNVNGDNNTINND